VCILREDNFDKQGLIDYNFNCFREAIQEVFESRVNKRANAPIGSLDSNAENGLVNFN
jgi:hypothetical protein